MIISFQIKEEKIFKNLIDELDITKERYEKQINENELIQKNILACRANISILNLKYSESDENRKYQKIYQNLKTNLTN